MTPEQRRFLDAQRVARLATADPAGVPHLVPVCFALEAFSALRLPTGRSDFSPPLQLPTSSRGERLYITIDEKPKSGDALALKRIRNILANPAVAVLVDHWDEDWTRLAWVMLRGRAEVLLSGPGAEHGRAQALLRARYPQYRVMQLEALPVIAVTIERVTSWGAV